MKNTTKMISLLAANIMILMTGAAVADTLIPWTDNTIYWDGYPSRDPAENTLDSIGGPRIIWGAVVISDTGFLKQAVFNFKDWWNVEKFHPGDLFLSTDSDSDWDYVMSLYNGKVMDGYAQYIPTVSYDAYGYYNVPLYELNSPATYLLTGPDSDPYWNDQRNDHPYAVTGLTGDNSGSGSVQIDINKEFLVFNLPANTVGVGDFLTVGFTTNCANDVIYETVVPEPSTFIFLGSGLLLMAGFVKRKLP
ncbi:MAG: PEP-CTERM sorting domain-containing protein [Acidobacteria bacterium]|nr:PEP-CTERM sorting domain-containing protein [Acidobacteriota bacterium]